MQQILFGPWSVLEANLSKKINFLSAYCHIHETWVPREETQEFSQDSFRRTQRMRITSSVTENGVRVQVINCFSDF